MLGEGGEAGDCVVTLHVSPHFALHLDLPSLNYTGPGPLSDNDNNHNHNNLKCKPIRLVFLIVTLYQPWYGIGIDNIDWSLSKGRCIECIC